MEAVRDVTWTVMKEVRWKDPQSLNPRVHYRLAGLWVNQNGLCLNLHSSRVS